MRAGNTNAYAAGPSDPFGPILTDSAQTSLYLVYHVAGADLEPLVARVACTRMEPWFQSKRLGRLPDRGIFLIDLVPSTPCLDLRLRIIARNGSERDEAPPLGGAPGPFW